MHRGRIVAEGNLDELREQTGCPTLIEMFSEAVGSRSRPGGSWPGDDRQELNSELSSSKMTESGAWGGSR